MGETKSRAVASEPLDRYLSNCAFARRMRAPRRAIQPRPEAAALSECLMKERMRSAVIVGPAGCGKTDLALAAMAKDKGRAWVELSVAALLGGTEYRGQFEERAMGLLKAIADERRISGTETVLFVDECHMLWGAGRLKGGCVDMVNILKPFLADGTVTLVGATTPKEFASTVALDPAFMRRVTPIALGEPPEAVTVRACSQFCAGDVPDRLIKEMVRKSAGISYWSANPDRSIECLDRAMAKSRARGTGRAGTTAADMDAALADMGAAFSLAEEFLKSGGEGAETGGKERR